MTRGNPCLMVRGSAKTFPAPLEIRSADLRPGIRKNQEHQVILRLAASSEEGQDSSIPLVWLSRRHSVSWICCLLLVSLPVGVDKLITTFPFILKTQESKI